jgi:hypothetical protein
MNTPALLRLGNQMLASHNQACFIERESLLRAHAGETAACPTETRYLPS